MKLQDCCYLLALGLTKISEVIDALLLIFALAQLQIALEPLSSKKLVKATFNVSLRLSCSHACKSSTSCPTDWLLRWRLVKRLNASKLVLVQHTTGVGWGKLSQRWEYRNRLLWCTAYLVAERRHLQQCPLWTYIWRFWIHPTDKLLPRAPYLFTIRQQLLRVWSSLYLLSHCSKL